MAQEVERVVSLLEGTWFNPQLLQSACQSVNNRTLDPDLPPMAFLLVSVYVFKERVGTLI